MSESFGYDSELPAPPAAAEPAPKKRAPRRKTSPAANNQKMARRTARATAHTMLAVQAAQPEDRALLAALLGCEDDDVELTAHIAVPGVNNVAQTATDLERIAAHEGDEAIIEAGSLPAARVKAAWSVLTQMDLVSGEIPASDVLAALKIARAVDENSEAITARLSAVQKLLAL